MRRAEGEDPSAGRPESREAKVCSVGTSMNSPFGLLLSHFVSIFSMTTRQVFQQTLMPLQSKSGGVLQEKGTHLVARL